MPCVISVRNNLHLKNQYILLHAKADTFMKITILNKPFNVLSQFREEAEHTTLANYITDTELRVAGRLDRDSEGLLILTDHGGLNQYLTSPKKKQYKTYLAQVDGAVDAAAVQQLCNGVELNDGMTLPALVKIVEEPTWLWDRTPPIRYRANIPTTWLEIKIMEGRNRQVRRMTSAVGYPTLRLIRTQVGPINLTDLNLKVGEARSLEPLLFPEFKKIMEHKETPKKFFASKSKTSHVDKKTKKQDKKRDEVLIEIFKTDAVRPRRITNGTTRPNLKKGRGRRTR